jgi:hypothetical protein
VSSRVLKYNNLFTWRWTFRFKHVVKLCLIKEQWMTLHTEGAETPKLYTSLHTFSLGI